MSLRNQVRKIAFVGVPDRGIAESLREYGYRVEGVQGDSIVALAREVYRMRPAVVHARVSHVKAGVVAKLLDIPLLVQAGREDVGGLTAHAARMAARTVCGGVAVREALLDHGAPASTSCVMRSLIDVEGDLRAAAIFPPMLDPAIRWVVAASPCDGPDRGHQDLLLAFLTLARTRPRLKLLIAGEGAEARRLRAQAQQAGALNRVVVLPVSLEQVPSVFARAAVVVGPSRGGGLLDPVPEALAVGAPVVATSIGPHATWIREGRTGWLVPPRAPAALAARLVQVVDDPEASRKVGANARLAAAEAASPRSAALELARCYTAISRVPVTRYGGIYLPARDMLRA
ncbi:MAG TPA: glycosyltransferase [Myxococcales bacterium]|nr:glycosyltransferase [Myxococcales bacterium]